MELILKLWEIQGITISVFETIKLAVKNKSWKQSVVWKHYLNEMKIKWYNISI